MLRYESTRSSPNIITLLVMLYTLIVMAGCFELGFDQFIQSTPSTYGLLTVTHARKGTYQYFKAHLDKYAKMQCPEITEISVVWNNDITPEQAGISQDSNWKRPVYFRKTPYNSMDFRYLLPAESTAKVFFCIDDDIITTCQQLTKSFGLWRKQAIGDIGPIMSYGPRGFDFTTSSQQFRYTDPLNARFYSMSLIGVAWVSKFYLDLYNSEKSWEITQMRDIVRQKNNCDDIALNYIAQHFFPQLVPIPLGGDLTFTIKPQAQGFTRTHYTYRNQCLKRFTQILRYCPLRLINKADPGSADRFVSTALKYSIYFKRKQLAERLLQSSSAFTQSKSQIDKVSNQLSEQNKQLNKNGLTYKSKNVARADKQSIQETFLDRQNTQQNKQIENKLKSQNAKLSSQVQKLNEQISLLKQRYQTLAYSMNVENKKEDKRISQTKEQYNNDSIDFITNVSILIGIFLLFILAYLIWSSCKPNNIPAMGLKYDEMNVQNIIRKKTVSREKKNYTITKQEEEDSGEQQK